MEEFYPIVHLGDSYLEQMLVQHGLKVRNESESGHILNVDFNYNLTGEHQTDLKFPVCYLKSSFLRIFFRAAQLFQIKRKTRHGLV